MTRPSVSAGPPHFLLVEDNDLVARFSRRVLERYGAVSVATTAAEARGVVVATARLTGLVADISLPDGTGLDVARETRARAPRVPILIISGAVDAPRLDAADELGASYLLKPVDIRQLSRFAQRAIDTERRSARLLEAWIDQYGLSAAETVTLRLALDGLRRDGIASARRVSANTVKTQVGTLLVKVGAASLAEVVTAFYSELAALR